MGNDDAGFIIVLIFANHKRHKVTSDIVFIFQNVSSITVKADSTHGTIRQPE